jgi:kinesin family protein 4/21/27
MDERIIVEVREASNEVICGEGRCFTFDKSFNHRQTQEHIFEICVKNLVLGCFCGFNATVLAYGQTGSGKTFTMGSGFTLGVKEEDLGIIPRVIRLIYAEEQARRDKA